MTMFPKQLSKNNCYGGYMGELGGYDCFGNKEEILENNNNNFRSDQSSMAEQEDSRTESTTVNEAAGSSSKEEREDGNWLQLGIGNSISQEIINKQDEDINTRRRTTGLVELNLLPETSVRNQNRPLVPDFEFRPPNMPISSFMTGYGSGARSGFSNYITATGTSSVAPMFFQQGSGSYLFPQHHEVNWGFRPRNMLISPSSATSSPSTSFVPPYIGYQLRGGDVAGPSFDFRIIDPPRRPNCGIWFLLQASQNQEKVPILPQVPKSYLRIKDGRMTVRLLMKYLVNKLRLDNESEIEIRCRGERLEPYLTLQHVRDTIWNNNNNNSNYTNSSSSSIATDHIMVLHYARS